MAAGRVVAGKHPRLGYIRPVIVVTHDRTIPLGYDADRLCLVSLAALQPGAPGYDAEKQDSATLMDNYMNLVRRARGFEGVERTTPLMGFCYPCSQGSSSSVMMAENDTLRYQMLWMQFLPHTQFFETYGFRPAAGRTPSSCPTTTMCKTMLCCRRIPPKRFSDGATCRAGVAGVLTPMIRLTFRWSVCWERSRLIVNGSPSWLLSAPCCLLM